MHHLVINLCIILYFFLHPIVELCSSYTAMVFEPNAAYRNVHCAICNNASLDKLICLNLGPFGRFNWQQNFNSFSFAVLFDISGDVGDKVGFGKHILKLNLLKFFIALYFWSSAPRIYSYFPLFLQGIFMALLDHFQWFLITIVGGFKTPKHFHDTKKGKLGS